MMKTFGLVFALMVVLSCGAFASTATVDTYAGWNLIALPLVPFDPVVDDVLTGYDTWFTAGISKWDAPSQGMIAYDAFDPTTFGSMLLGDGYWMQYPDAGQIQYQGVPDGVPTDVNDPTTMTDMWISLPGNQLDGQDIGGWQLIGQPFNHDTPVDPNGNLNGEAIKFTDGTTVKTWDEAAQAGWVDSTFSYWNGAAQGMQTVGYFFNDDDTLRAGHGYWVYTHKDNLAMIIPAN